jgi:hypothetical protein
MATWEGNGGKRSFCMSTKLVRPISIYLNETYIKVRRPHI